MMDKNLQSKNIKAEKLVGKRGMGTPFQEPFELDYACPICCKPINKDTKIFDEHGNLKPEYERLHFSEYNGFMWCENCNIDIPSFLCLCANSKEAVEIYTDRFLHFLSEFKERIYKPLTEEEKDMQYMMTKIIDLEGEVKRLERDNDFHDSFINYLNKSWINRLQSKIFTIKFNRKQKKKDKK